MTMTKNNKKSSITKIWCHQMQLSNAHTKIPIPHMNEHHAYKQGGCGMLFFQLSQDHTLGISITHNHEDKAPNLRERGEKGRTLAQF
jgi:hypothetical protein